MLLLTFLLALLVEAGLFVPALTNIGPFDESVYLNRGRLLVEGGEWPALVNSPLTAVFYAVTYLPFRHSARWLIESCILGRLLLFAGLWAGFLSLAREALPDRSRVSVLGWTVLLLLVTPLPEALVRNGSDALFALMACLSLQQLLSFENHRRWRSLVAASLLAGASFLARPEGISFLFVGLLLLLFRRHESRPAPGRVLVSWVVPQVGTWVLFIAIQSLAAGSLEPPDPGRGGDALGLAQRSYFNFEQGEGLAIADLAAGKVRYLEGQLVAREKYGSGEENDYSILTAIGRNPGGYAERVARSTLRVPLYVLEAYGGYPGVFIFLLAFLGFADLVREHRIALLVAFAAWPAHLVSNLLVAYREEHFLLPSFILITLAAHGMRSLSGAGARGLEVRNFQILAGVLFLFAAVAQKPLALLVFSIFVVGSTLARSAGRLCVGPGATRVVIGALLIGSYWAAGAATAPLARVGERPEAAKLAAAAALGRELGPETRIGAYSPQVVYLARRTPVEMYLDLRSLDSVAELTAWMEENEVAGIYVDEDFRRRELRLWSLVESSIGDELEIVFSSADRDHLVLRVRTTAP